MLNLQFPLLPTLLDFCFDMYKFGQVDVTEFHLIDFLDRLGQLLTLLLLDLGWYSKNRRRLGHGSLGLFGQSLS